MKPVPFDYKKNAEGCLHEEQRNAAHTDDGAHDFAPMDALVEEKVRGPDDEYRRHSHDGLGNADGGVECGHERETHADERPRDGGS